LSVFPFNGIGIFSGRLARWTRFTLTDFSQSPPRRSRKSAFCVLLSSPPFLARITFHHRPWVLLSCTNSIVLINMLFMPTVTIIITTTHKRRASPPPPLHLLHRRPSTTPATARGVTKYYSRRIGGGFNRV